MHTHNSLGSRDSKVSPRELVTEAKKRGINAICVTDHDSYEGIKEVQEIGKIEGITVIEGIELSTKYGHLLIFGVNINTILEQNLNELANQMKNKKYDNLEKLKGNIFSFMSATTSEIDTLIERVHEHSGVVVLAHTFGRYGENELTLRHWLDLYLKSNSEFTIFDVKIDELLDFITEQDTVLSRALQKIDGVEVLNPLCLGVENKAAFVLAEFLNKSKTGGSDCHSPSTVGICATKFLMKYILKPSFYLSLDKEKRIPFSI